MPRLENYTIYTGYSERTKYASGEVYGSDKFNDGEFITTSKLCEVGDDYIMTKNTRYELGIPTEYQKNKPPRSVKFYLLKKGADAIHKMGNIKRDSFDAELIVVHFEDEECYIGNFAEGFGFIDVKFKKSDCRLAIDDELYLCDLGNMSEIVF